MNDYDIGMLRVLVVLYETGSVTAASRRLNLSQPSVSYTLRKLRVHFGDELFRRRRYGLEPTPMTEGLYPKFRRLVESLDEVMAGASEFEPGSATQNFRLRMTDAGIAGLLPSILTRVRDQAPGVTLEVEPLNLDTAVSELRSGTADAVISTTRLDEPDIDRDHLFEQAYVGLCAEDHPRISSTPSIDAFEAEGRIAVSRSTGHSLLEQRLQELGMAGRPVAVVPTFTSLPNLLEGGDLVSYAPTGVASRLIARNPVRVFTLPFDLPVTRVALYTSRRELPSPAMQWLRRTVIAAVREERSVERTSPASASGHRLS